MSPSCTRPLSELGRGNPRPRSLTVLHTTRLAPNQAYQHAATFWLSSPSWLVTGALILATNGPTNNETLSHYLSYYPHRSKTACPGLPNGGYRCGQFESWHRLSPAWLMDSEAPALHAAGAQLAGLRLGSQ